ncbi:hypothetical protein AVEN_102288-1 [Araneus ventricosus]|uniref:CRAL/TRIO N-terminal domain-containing protein n=1 Tax=Araneus ventricosus TaxID=182803 RepID=A0A4Y2IFI8_ARAVE|nr:hypothetical protein AVEN_102288-1 [Araneus ventricosus]
MTLNISSEEQAVIEELKRRTIDCVTPKMLEDNYLFYRFAKAQNFNISEAELMLRKNAYWRKEFGVDTVLVDYTAPEDSSSFHSVICRNPPGTFKNSKGLIVLVDMKSYRPFERNSRFSLARFMGS